MPVRYLESSQNELFMMLKDADEMKALCQSAVRDGASGNVHRR